MTRLPSILLSGLILAGGCAVQGTGFVTHRERVRSGVALQGRVRAMREAGPFVGTEIATGLGGNPTGVRLKSAGVLLGYDGRRDALGIPWLGAEIALVTAYGRPLGEPELEEAAYFFGTQGALSFRLGDLEEARPSFSVLLYGFDLVLEAQAGVWWTARNEPAYSHVYSLRVGLGLRFHLETDLLANRQ